MNREWTVFAGAGIFVVMMLSALQRGCPTDSAGADEVKRAFLREHPDIDKLHHKVWKKVGEDRWEGDVKQAILRDLTVATIRETGDLFPSWESVSEWVDQHPEQAREIFRRYLEEDD